MNPGPLPASGAAGTGEQKIRVCAEGGVHHEGIDPAERPRTRRWWRGGGPEAVDQAGGRAEHPPHHRRPGTQQRTEQGLKPARRAEIGARADTSEDGGGAREKAEPGRRRSATGLSQCGRPGQAWHAPGVTRPGPHPRPAAAVSAGSAVVEGRGQLRGDDIRDGALAQVPVVARLLPGLGVVEPPAQVVADVVERGVQVLLGRGGDDLLPAGDPALQGDLLPPGLPVLHRHLQLGGVGVEAASRASRVANCSAIQARSPWEKPAPTRRQSATVAGVLVALLDMSETPSVAYLDDHRIPRDDPVHVPQTFLGG